MEPLESRAQQATVAEEERAVPREPKVRQGVKDLQEYPEPWVLADEVDRLVEEGLPEYQGS